MKHIFSYIRLFFLCSCCVLTFFCSIKTTAQQVEYSISHLKFIDEYDLPNAFQFKGTTVGGLSGIDYDFKRDLYYLISDDRSAINPARFYTAKIHFKTT